jgi:hypothetical protein
LFCWISSIHQKEKTSTKETIFKGCLLRYENACQKLFNSGFENGGALHPSGQGCAKAELVSNFFISISGTA